MDGTREGGWSEAQLGAFLMAAAIRGLDRDETLALTRHMLESGERWALSADFPSLVDKHSTGGVGDKVSLLLGPLLAACGIPVAMLTGRSLGHTGGTADKLESIPGLDLALDRERCCASLRRCGLAIGLATPSIAPADRRLYALRDKTGTVSSLPLVISSILSKKLATGASAIVFDVKTGSGAFFPELEDAVELGRQLVEIAELLGTRARALVTDMSQPLGEWVGHTGEVREVYECLSGSGDSRLVEVTLELAEELTRLAGAPRDREALRAILSDGEARGRFELWAESQGAEVSWLHQPRFPLAPVEVALEAPSAGVLSAVDARQLGLLLGEAGAGRASATGPIDLEVALRYRVRLGGRVERSQELARLYLRRRDEGLERRFAACFSIDEEGKSPPLVYRRLAG